MTPIARSQEPIIAPTQLVRPMGLTNFTEDLPRPMNDNSGSVPLMLLPRRRKRKARRER